MLYCYLPLIAQCYYYAVLLSTPDSTMLLLFLYCYLPQLSQGYYYAVLLSTPDSTMLLLCCIAIYL